MAGSGLHERMREATGDRTLRAIGELTGHHPENVRRWMGGHAPSVEFLAALCDGLGLNGHWLLTGEGPSRRAPAGAIGAEGAASLLSSVAAALERVEDRLTRLEVSTQTMETRLRAAQGREEP